MKTIKTMETMKRMETGETREGGTAYCETCRGLREYVVAKAPATGRLKGEEYGYLSDVARCAACGTDVDVGSIRDRNLDALYDAFRAKNGIVPRDVVARLPAKYGIGKRPLSRILGMGELTFTRYLDGAVPSTPYSELLRRVDEDPRFYLELLEGNRDKLDSDKAYEKSLRTVMGLMGIQATKGGKLFRVADYLVRRSGDTTNLSLQKALYYAQGFHFAFTGRYLFPENCEAWVLGPVYPTIYNAYKLYRYDPIPGETEPGTEGFEEEEIAVLDGVVAHVCCYSGNELLRFTHEEKPWIDARKGKAPEEKSNAVIPKARIGDYFVQVKEEYRMKTPDDIAKYTQDLFARVRTEKGRSR